MLKMLIYVARSGSVILSLYQIAFLYRLLKLFPKMPERGFQTILILDNYKKMPQRIIIALRSMADRESTVKM